MSVCPSVRLSVCPSSVTPAVSGVPAADEQQKNNFGPAIGAGAL